MLKTNAIRILEKEKIYHELFEYNVDENSLDAITVANKIGAEHEQVFKTLVARGDEKNIFVFCIPGNMELNLKKAAKISGSKKVEMIKMKDILSLTGYIRGGCSPIGMKKSFPTFIDETAQCYNKIYLSAGVRGIQIKISPEELINLLNAKYSDLL